MEHATLLYNDVGAIHTAHSAEGLGKQQMVAQVLVPQAAHVGDPLQLLAPGLGLISLSHCSHLLSEPEHENSLFHSLTFQLSKSVLKKKTLQGNRANKNNLL